MKKAPYIIIFILLVLVFTLSLYILQDLFLSENKLSLPNISEETEEIEKPLEAYTFQNLKKTEIPASNITFGDVTEKNDDFTRRLFYFETPIYPGSTEMNKVSGLATIPTDSENSEQETENEYPVIIMHRGFVPESIFVSGAGTSPSAGEIAKAGFITLAPDFLGFGDSASPSADPFENRFQTYTTSLSLLESLRNLNSGLDDEYVGTISADLEKIGLWGHSNGGHIALAALSLTGKEYPTVLWAPVSKSFPYSILYYTDETQDQGKGLRSALYGFEELYDTEDFSPERYFRWIKAPILINQGTDDPEVPYWWSDELVQALESEEIDVTYIKYPGANHNLQPSWNEAVTNTIDFFNAELK